MKSSGKSSRTSGNVFKRKMENQRIIIKSKSNYILFFSLALVFIYFVVIMISSMFNISLILMSLLGVFTLYFISANHIYRYELGHTYLVLDYPLKIVNNKRIYKPIKIIKISFHAGGSPSVFFRVQFVFKEKVKKINLILDRVNKKELIDIANKVIHSEIHFEDRSSSRFLNKKLNT